MFRSGFLLSVSGPAAILTLLVQPTVRQAADHWTPTAPIARSAPADISVGPRNRLPIHPLASTAISPIRVAAIPGTGPRMAPPQTDLGRTASDKGPVKVRRPVQEGCERAISSLAGPEARRMVPGRCMT